MKVVFNNKDHWMYTHFYRPGNKILNRGVIFHLNGLNGTTLLCFLVLILTLLTDEKGKQTELICLFIFNS